MKYTNTLMKEDDHKRSWKTLKKRAWLYQDFSSKKINRNKRRSIAAIGLKIKIKIK